MIHIDKLQETFIFIILMKAYLSDFKVDIAI
jgi:hypothetical protein